ncbi:MAG: type II CAAX endopeptidase family protein [bacterium]|nr:type II CAAX endopeptidase family protein [bacterium]
MNNRNSVIKGNALFFMIIINYLVLNIGLNIIVGIFHVQITYIESILIAQFGYALPAIVYAFSRKRPVRNHIRLKKINLLTILLLIIFAFAIMPLMTFINSLSLLIGHNTINSTITGMLDQTSFVWCLLAVGVLPAVMEEFVYRGVIYNEQREGNVIKAILCSGLFFGLLHMNINQFSYAFVLGAIFAVLTEATGTILSSMIVHATINSFSVTLSKIQPYLMERMNQIQQSAGQEVTPISDTLSRADIIQMLPTYFVSAIFSAAFSAFIVFLIIKYNKRENEVRQIVSCSPEEKNRRKQVAFADVWFILAVTICVVIMLSREISYWI